ncbi:Cof-type HAD-IIB family hydrolase [Enterocloster lavalensis]|uniref:Cof-type HAD-IIB family hydrolase n=1 Tax=Enterocloster lavalensis TaxID=460384 RepID=UPI0026665E69|nr:Cof-type HAD-IIB family hydrolase [Enterocloster lavalensis]
MIRMIATDIDGTLINDQGIITPQTRKALIAAQEKGIRLVIATGRSPQYTRAEQEQLEMQRFTGDYIIALNGQEIFRFSDHSTWTGRKIPAGSIPDVLKLAFEYDLEALCYDGGSRYHYLPPDFYAKKEAWLRRFPSLAPTDFESILGERISLPSWNSSFDNDINKIAFLHSAPRLREVLPLVRRRLPSGLQALLVKPTWLEIFPAEINKGGALGQIMEETGIQPDEVLAFGDGENDIGMLKSVTFGFAMGNAFPSVKEAACAVTASNNCDGIARVVNALCLTHSA